MQAQKLYIESLSQKTVDGNYLEKQYKNKSSNNKAAAFWMHYKPTGTYKSDV